MALFGLCVYTFTIVTYKVNLAVPGVIIGILGIVVGRARFRLPFPVWLFAAFLLWALLASFASPYPDIARTQLIESSKLLVIMIVVVNALRTQGQLRFFLLFVLGCFILFPIRGALVNYMAGYTVFGRALWNYIYANPNDLAALCLLALGVALATWMSTRSRAFIRFCAGIASVLLLVVILLSQSRGAFLGLAIAMLVLIVKSLKISPRRTFCLIAIFLIVAFSVPESVWDRLYGIRALTSTTTIHEADGEGSAAQRFEIQKVGWNIFLDHSVFGVGLGAYPLVNASYAPELGQKSAHNTYLALAAEVGLPGLLLWCALVGSVLCFAYRAQKRSALKALVEQQRWIWWGFVAYLVAGVFGSYEALTFPYLMLGVLWCSGNLLYTSEMPADMPPRRQEDAECAE